MKGLYEYSNICSVLWWKSAVLIIQVQQGLKSVIRVECSVSDGGFCCVVPSWISLGVSASDCLNYQLRKGNNIKEVSKLANLTELEEAGLSRNDIKYSESLREIIDKYKQPKILSLLSNPASATSGDIEAEAIPKCTSLDEFNNMEISDQKRECIQAMSTRKIKTVTLHYRSASPATQVM